MTRQRLDHFRGADPLPMLPVDHVLATVDEVPAPQFDRVDAQLRGQVVEDRLDGERALRPARPAIRPGPDAIRQHAVAANVPRRPDVRPGDENGPDPVERGFGERARVVHEPRL